MFDYGKKKGFSTILYSEDRYFLNNFVKRLILLGTLSTYKYSKQIQFCTDSSFLGHPTNNAYIFLKLVIAVSAIRFNLRKRFFKGGLKVKKKKKNTRKKDTTYNYKVNYTCSEETYRYTFFSGKKHFPFFFYVSICFKFSSTVLRRLSI